jgi:hypothetical protein
MGAPDHIPNHEPNHVPDHVPNHLPAEHRPGCVLDPVHWLRHAVAAAGLLAQPAGQQDPDADRRSAEALTDALAHFAELDDWASVTLLDVTRHANLMASGRFDQMCTCGATSKP